MRFALLSDVHANLGALQEVLESLRYHEVDRVLVAGDLVGYGPQPNECVAALADIGAECVAGNHDLFVLDRLPPTRFPSLARRSAALTRSMLSAEVRDFLMRLPLLRQVEGVLMAHGSLDDPEEYVLEQGRAAQLLARLPHEAPGADTLVLGHTHRQWCVVTGGGGDASSPAARQPACRSSAAEPRQRRAVPPVGATAPCSLRRPRHHCRYGRVPAPRLRRAVRPRAPAHAGPARHLPSPAARSAQPRPARRRPSPALTSGRRCPAPTRRPSHRAAPSPGHCRAPDAQEPPGP